NYTAPTSLFSAKLRRDFPSHGWMTQFTIQGKVDWQTGKIEWKIPDGQIKSFSEGKVDKYPYRQDVSHAYSATLTGRHTSDPGLSASIKTMTDLLAKAPGGAPEDNEAFGLPNVTSGPAGQSQF